MTQVHFIAGLPRSGSTVLAAILRQNPLIHASMSSPVNATFNAVHKSVSGSNEASMFYDDEQRIALLRGVFNNVYGDRKPFAFDTNRLWPAKLSILHQLFPFKIICCVRRVAEIVDSFERVVKRAPFQTSGMFGYESGDVYAHARNLMADNGIVGAALNAFRDGYYSPFAADHMILVEYEALARNPEVTIAELYGFLKLPRFKHDFDAIEQIPGAEEFDRSISTPGLHRLSPRVAYRPHAPIIPPDLFNGLPASFWRERPNPNVVCIHCDERAEAGTTPLSEREIDAMMARAKLTLETHRLQQSETDTRMEPAND